MSRSLEQSLDKAKTALKDLKAAKKGMRKVTMKNCKSQSFALPDVLSKHGKVVGSSISALVTKFYKAVISGKTLKAKNYKSVFTAKLAARIERAEKKVAKLKAQWKLAKANMAVKKGGAKKKAVKAKKLGAKTKKNVRKPRVAKKAVAGGAAYMKSLFGGNANYRKAEFAELVL